MSAQTIDFLLLEAIVLIFVVLGGLLLVYSYKVNRKIDKLLEKGKIKDFKEIILRQKERSDKLEQEIKKVNLRIENLEKISEITIKKIGIVRFNPFNDMGGNQSFVVAILDSRNNGFLISSFFSQEGNRVYAKTIKQGRSDYSLSEEESEAVNRAINSKNV